MTNYYTMESVRDSIVANKYEIQSSLDKPVPLPTWNKYPCKKWDNCKDVYCDGYVVITIVIGNARRWIYLEIRFFRDKQKAFIRMDNPQMLELISIGILTHESLKGSIETF